MFRRAESYTCSIEHMFGIIAVMERAMSVLSDTKGKRSRHHVDPQEGLR